jgi:hypothetical protein
MEGDEDGLAPVLVIVRHPEKGDRETGRIICQKILNRLAKTEGLVCIFHDAREMVTANAGYAGAFKDLDKALEKRVVRIVCAIPGTIPRMMAHTVAMISRKRWNIYKDRREALGYLSGIGYVLSALEINTLEDVAVKLFE